MQSHPEHKCEEAKNNQLLQQLYSGFVYVYRIDAICINIVMKKEIESEKDKRKMMKKIINK